MEANLKNSNSKSGAASLSKTKPFCNNSNRQYHQKTIQIKKALLKRILNFYNNQENWEKSTEHFATVYQPNISALEKDNGELANLGLKLMRADKPEMLELIPIIKEKLMRFNLDI